MNADVSLDRDPRSRGRWRASSKDALPELTYTLCETIALGTTEDLDTDQLLGRPGVQLDVAVSIGGYARGWTHGGAGLQ